MRGKAARTSAELRTILVLTSIGATITLFAALRGGPLLPLLYALVIGFDGCIAYVYWYSRFATRDRNTLAVGNALRSEEHTSELQSLMRISYAVFCLKKKKKYTHNNHKRPMIKNH